MYFLSGTKMPGRIQIENQRNAKGVEEDTMKNRKRLAMFAMAAVMTMGLTACGSSDNGAADSADKGESKAAAAEVDSVYVYGESVPNEYESADINMYELALLDDGTYRMTTTNGVQGYSMLLGTTVVTATGTYEMGEASDGMSECKLSKADRILYNSYSDMGGYNIAIDSKDAAYPVELPNDEQADEAAFFDAFGAERTVYVTEDSNVFSLTAE